MLPTTTINSIWSQGLRLDGVQGALKGKACTRKHRNNQNPKLDFQNTSSIPRPLNALRMRRKRPALHMYSPNKVTGEHTTRISAIDSVHRCASSPVGTWRFQNRDQLQQGFKLRKPFQSRILACPRNSPSGANCNSSAMSATLVT